MERKKIFLIFPNMTCNFNLQSRVINIKIKIRDEREKWKKKKTIFDKYKTTMFIIIVIFILAEGSYDYEIGIEVRTICASSFYFLFFML